MRILEFKTMQFKTGLNLTVRNGRKWADAHSGDVVAVQETGSGVTSFEATVQDVVVMPWSDVTDAMLVAEHSPECQTKQGLADAMDSAYGPGSWGPEVALLLIWVSAENAPTAE